MTGRFESPPADEQPQIASLREELERVRQRLAEYDLIFDSTPIMFWYKDANNGILRVNRAAAALEGLHPQDLEGKRCEDVYPPEQAAAYYADDLEVLSSGIPKLNIVEPHTAPGSGETRWLHVGKVPTRNASGQIDGVIAFAMDVSERRKLEEERRHVQKMESVGRLAGGVAHDFNNLLGGIMGAAELLRMRQLPPDADRDVELIVRAAERAAELTGQLLQFSRKGSTRRTPCDVVEAANSVVAILQRTSDPRVNIRLEHDARPATLLAEAGSVQSAILNLALNARDAMPDGGTLSIRVAAVELEQPRELSHGQRLLPGPYAEVRVTDTGSGIAPENFAHIFEPFFTTKEIGKGTGLGLAAVYGTAQHHGGGIDVKSQLGEGSTFTLFLALQSDPYPSASPASSEALEGRGRILLAEDEPLLQQLGRRVLEDAGYEVVVVADGQAALECCERDARGFDLAVFDVTMPRLSGPEAFDRLRLRHPHLRVLFVTGFDFTRAAERSSLSSYPLLEKPYKPDDLKAAVARLLAK
jgi:PAS domain S-box-containing protein